MEREIHKKPNVPELNQGVIELLSNLCFREDIITKSDLVFAFGTNIVPERLSNTIEFILLNEYASEVIITGGIANYIDSYVTSIPESLVIYNLIDIEKFPSAKFHIEKESKNNLENVNNAAKIIDFSKIDSVICISHSYASTRSVQSLKNVFKGRIQSFPYSIPSNEENISVEKNNWWKTDIGRSLVWGEFLRFKKYGMRGDFMITEEMKDIIIKIDSLTSITN